MDIKQIIVSGIAAGIIILIVSMVISMDFQLLFDYNVLTLAGMRAPNDPIMILFFLQPFVIGLAMATLYEYTKKALKAKQKGQCSAYWAGQYTESRQQSLSTAAWTTQSASH